MKYFLILLLMTTTSLFASAAQPSTINHAPELGAQVFIEPGQTTDDVRQWMRILHDHHMTVCRIRMFEDHFRQPDGSWDFALYDAAFEEAERLGIRVFATLFPHCAMDDLGGPKFPTSDAEYAQTMDFVRHTVEHFRHFRSMYAWVLQNEPGDGKMTGNPWLDKLKETASLENPETPGNPGNPGNPEWMKRTFDDERFTRFALNHYLSLIAAEIRKIDTEHDLHVNPHDICKTLPEYDFQGMSQYLNSLGASMHMSWHFWLFQRHEFPLGVAFMSDLLRPNACGHPFWVTELQGGNVTFSGRIPVCPSADDIAQWLWTAVASGSEGIIFWTLNQRAAYMEAGEWGMVDFQRRPSDRLTMAGKVAETLQQNADFFKEAAPVKSPVTILYNKESLFISHSLGGLTPTREDENTGIPMARQTSAVMRSVIACYKSLTALGHSPAIADMERWTPDVDCTGQTVILPNMLAIPSAQNAALRTFVERGGRLLLTGLAGYYDEYARCQPLVGQPLADLLGADVSEYKYVAERFELPLDVASLQKLQTPPLEGEAGRGLLPTSCWRGILRLNGAEALGREGDDVVAARHKYGRGEVIWIPSPIEIGARLSEDYAPYEAFLSGIVGDGQFAQPVDNVSLRLLESKAGRLAVFVNMGAAATSVKLNTLNLKQAKQIFGNAEVAGASQLTLAPHSVAVFRLKK